LRFFSFFFLTFAAYISNAEPVKVAIVIDDIGYRHSDNAILTLTGDVTFSILPHTPYGKKLALQAFQRHHDILLHIPMEAENGKKLGPGALTTKMNEANIRASLANAFAEIPFAIGINNHMGSLLTQLPDPMYWTMRFLKERSMFFLDSVTSSNSQAGKIAKLLQVPTLKRTVFLDNQLDQAYIEKQFLQLINQAQQNKFAIAIAHPHPETIKALQDLIPTLKQHNIELVPISTLYSPQIKNTVTSLISD
jgi:hypothetical protein